MNNKKIWGIIIACLIVFCIVACVIALKPKKEVINDDTEKTEELKKYAFVGANGVNYLEGLDFSHKEKYVELEYAELVGEDDRKYNEPIEKRDISVSIKNGKIYYSNLYYDLNNIEIKTKGNDIISVGLDSSCAGVTSIVYLTQDHKLYEFPDFHQLGLPEEGSEILISDNASGFTLFDVADNEYTTCGGRIVLFKEVGSDGIYTTTYVNDSRKTVLAKLNYKYISGNDSTIFIYVVDNENVAGYDIIKNDQGEIIKAKEIYKGYIENINKNYVIVVDEEDKMYLFNEEENPQNNKSNETLIKESSDKFTFVNDKNETETIEVEQVY